MSLLVKQLLATIEAERIRQGLTLKELSFRAGISEKHLSRINTGNVNPSLNVLDKVVKALNLKIKIGNRSA